ncbi:MAG: hypothetical protein QOJ72_2792, partial [Nocardioidaceae bacterium]|nr:hypothetical protein [Nocardioidaceae bacterium]
GTLALAVSTFAAVRSSNRSARTTERALLAGIRPLIVPSRLSDEPVKVGFMDEHWVKVTGGHGAVEATDDTIYFAISLRNVGNGLGILDSWDVYASREIGAEASHRDPSAFRRLTRDLYISGGEVGFWQGALRDPSEPIFAAVHQAVEQRTALTVDLLYADHEGGQHTISRMTLIPSEDGSWLAAVSRHWNLDRSDPR